MELLRRLAEKWRCSRAEAARRAIRQAAHREELPQTSTVPQSVGDAIIAMFDEMVACVPDEELRSLPADLSVNLDHYVYGTPKES